jgi:hypothetical protein
MYGYEWVGIKVMLAYEHIFFGSFVMWPLKVSLSMGYHHERFCYFPQTFQIDVKMVHNVPLLTFHTIHRS